MNAWQTAWVRLGSPVALFASVVCAIGLGLLAPDVALQLKPLGDAYLALFQMILLPFLLSAMLCSVARLMRTPGAKAYVKGLLTVYPLGLLLAAAIGLFWAWWLEPGALASSSAGNLLGQIVDATQQRYVTDLEVTLSTTAAASAPVRSALTELIPANIFAALNGGDTLKVLVFGVLFGLAMGRSMAARSELLEMLEGVYRSCQTFVRWLTTLLPLGLFAMLAAHVAESGLAPLVAMGGFVLAQGLGVLTLLAVALALVVWKTRRPLVAVVRALGPSMVLAIATRSSVACIPSGVQALVTQLKLPQLGVELLMPLGITVFRFGPALYFALCAAFIAQLYGRPLAATEMLVIVGASALAAVASSGTTGVLSISLVSLVCVPLRLPFEAALVLFIAVDALMDPLRTLGIVVGNCAACSWVASADAPKPESGHDEPAARPAEAGL